MGGRCGATPRAAHKASGVCGSDLGFGLVTAIEKASWCLYMGVCEGCTETQRVLHWRNRVWFTGQRSGHGTPGLPSSLDTKKCAGTSLCHCLSTYRPSYLPMSLSTCPLSVSLSLPPLIHLSTRPIFFSTYLVGGRWGAGGHRIGLVSLPVDRGPKLPAPEARDEKDFGARFATVRV